AADDQRDRHGSKNDRLVTRGARPRRAASTLVSMLDQRLASRKSRRGTHECCYCVPHNYGYENTGLSGGSEKMGTARSVHAAAKGSAFARSDQGALGQSRQSPIFRRLCCFRGCVRHKADISILVVICQKADGFFASVRGKRY